MIVNDGHSRFRMMLNDGNNDGNKDGTMIATMVLDDA